MQLKPRTVFTRAKVQSDVQRIIELYRRNGKFAARVDPADHPAAAEPRRPDLLDQRGPDHRRRAHQLHRQQGLRRRHAARPDRDRGKPPGGKFLATNDNYDPDRLLFDREQLRRFYVSHGYADFHVVSRGRRTDAGSHEPSTSPSRWTRAPSTTSARSASIPRSRSCRRQDLRPLIEHPSRRHLQRRPGGEGDRRADQRRRHQGLCLRRGRRPRSRATPIRARSMWASNIEQGPRVYIDKINIVGNTRTLDKVIRRELRFRKAMPSTRRWSTVRAPASAAWASSRTCRSRMSPGSQPDRTNLTVAGDRAVDRRAVGRRGLFLHLQRSSANSATPNQPVRPRPESAAMSLQASLDPKQFAVQLHRTLVPGPALAAGFDLYEDATNYNQATYQGDATAAVAAPGLPDLGIWQHRAALHLQDREVRPCDRRGADRCAGCRCAQNGSIIGFNYVYADLDDIRKPTNGATFSFSQNIGGFGGNAEDIWRTGTVGGYRPCSTVRSSRA